MNQVATSNGGVADRHDNCYLTPDLETSVRISSRRGSATGYTLTSDIVMVQNLDSLSLTQDTPVTSWNSNDKSDASNPEAVNSPHQPPTIVDHSSPRKSNSDFMRERTDALGSPEMTPQQRLEARKFVSTQGSATSIFSDGLGSSQESLSVMPVPAFEQSRSYMQRAISEKIHTPTAAVSERRDLPLPLLAGVVSSQTTCSDSPKAIYSSNQAPSSGRFTTFVSALPQSNGDFGDSFGSLEHSTAQNSTEFPDSPSNIKEKKAHHSSLSLESKYISDLSSPCDLADTDPAEQSDDQLAAQDQRRTTDPSDDIHPKPATLDSQVEEGMDTATLDFGIRSSLVHDDLAEDTEVKHRHTDAGLDLSEAATPDRTRQRFKLDRAASSSMSIPRKRASMDPVSEIQREDASKSGARQSQTDPNLKNGMMVGETGFGKGGKLIADRFRQKMGRVETTKIEDEEQPETNTQFLQRKFSGLSGAALRKATGSARSSSDGRRGSTDGRRSSEKGRRGSLDRSLTLPSNSDSIPYRRMSATRQASVPSSMDISLHSWTGPDTGDDENELANLLGSDVPLTYEVSEKVPRVKDPVVHRIYFTKSGGQFLIKSDEKASTLRARPAKVKDIESLREYPYNYAGLTVVVRENWFAKRIYEFQFFCPTGKQEFMDIIKELLPGVTTYV